MLSDPAVNHYGDWFGIIFFMVLYGLFLVFFPFYRKMDSKKPAGAYLAFVIAFALEMHGIPFSMYVVTAIFGVRLPDGILWGHTLGQYIGHWGMFINIAMAVTGLVLVYFGWRDIFHKYWKKDQGQGQLVTRGIYAYIRHPQYTGVLLITLGMIFEWATLPLLIMWPMTVVMYYRLARREEADMVKEFGAQYQAYRERTGMFLPRLFGRERVTTAA